MPFVRSYGGNKLDAETTEREKRGSPKIALQGHVVDFRFEVGVIVYLEALNLALPRPSKNKIDVSFRGEAEKPTQAKGGFKRTLEIMAFQS